MRHGLTQQEIDETKDGNVLTLTILTRETLTTDEMGFEVDTGMDLIAQAIERRDVELPVDPGRDDSGAHDEPVLRAACSFYGTSTSESKLKRYQRLVHQGVGVESSGIGTCSSSDGCSKTAIGEGSFRERATSP